MSTPERIFEMRTYHCVPGARDTVVNRFRDHTIRIFGRHGITVEGFWLPMVDDDAEREDLIYLCSYPSREAAAASWASFMQDPEWIEVFAASEAGRRSVTGADLTFMAPTDFSPMR